MLPSTEQNLCLNVKQIVNANVWLLFLFLTSVLVGASSDPSINIDDPISDDFFFMVWNASAKLNATIYDKVYIKAKIVYCKSFYSCQCSFSFLTFSFVLCCDTGLQVPATQLCPQHARAEGVLLQGTSLRHRPRAGHRGAEGHPRAAGPLPPQVPV